MSGGLSLVSHEASRADGAGPRLAQHGPGGMEPEEVHRVVRFGPVELYYLGSGAEVGKRRAHLSGSFVLCMPLEEPGWGGAGRGGFHAAPRGSAIMIAPDEDVFSQVVSPAPHLLVAVDSAALESTLVRILGRRLNRPLRFVKRLDLTCPAVRRLLDVVRLVKEELDCRWALSSHPVVARHLEQLVLTTLLSAVHHSYSDMLNDRGQEETYIPARIRRAVELIEAHAAEPLTVKDVAEAVGVGVRALQQGFRAHLGTTPTEYLRDVRLKRVRAHLLEVSPESGLSITDVAMRWGFNHLGRFAQAYRAMFGETPSATLRTKTVLRP